MYCNNNLFFLHLQTLVKKLLKKKRNTMENNVFNTARKILGLDIGTNSIGWALIDENSIDNEYVEKIIASGSRILGMDTDILKKFDQGQKVSINENRRIKRGARRLQQRYKNRRKRLLQVFKLLNWLPENFKIGGSNEIPDKILIPENIKYERINKLKEFLNLTENENISDELLVYFLKFYALENQITKEEFATILYHYNQKRGFKSSRKEKKTEIIDKKEEEEEQIIENFKIKNITDTGFKTKKAQNFILKIETEERGIGTFFYSSIPNWIGKNIDFIVTEKYNKKLKKDEIYYNLPKSDDIKFGKVISIVDTNEKTRFASIFKLEFQLSDGKIIDGFANKKSLPDWIGKEMEMNIKTETNKDGEATIIFKQVDSSNISETDNAKRRDELEKYLTENPDLTVTKYFLDNLKKERNFRIKNNIVYRKRYQEELLKIYEKQKELNSDFLKVSENNLQLIAKELYKNNKQNQNAIIKNDLKYLLVNDIIYYQRPLKSQKASIGNCTFEKFNFTDKTGKEYTSYYKVCPQSSLLFQEYRIWQNIHNLKIENIRTREDVTTEILTSQNKEKLFELFDNHVKVSLKTILKTLNLTEKEYELNFKTELWGNETKNKILNKVPDDKKIIFTENHEKLHFLWHILYSLNEDKDVINAIKSNFGFDEEICKNLAKINFDLKYASISAKAIKKVLPLMRCGKYWNEKDICPQALENIDRITETDEFIKKMPDKTRTKLFELKTLNDFQGLSSYLALSVVYGSHSDLDKEETYKSWKEIQPITLNSLRNPIVEQILNETQQVVKDIWKTYFAENERPDEIRIELSRELKNNAKEREQITKAIGNSTKDNERIKQILTELKLGSSDKQRDIEKLKLFIESGGEDSQKKFNDIKSFSKEDLKFKLWLECKHVSPYTGEPIILSELFTAKYQIEHIIPKTRFFDDSMQNKTICEYFINDEKGALTAYEYMKSKSYKNCKFGSFEEYEKFVTETFKKNKAKNRFLAKEIPQDFVNRQLKDSQYIAKKATQILSRICNVTTTSGGITDFLRQNWGVNDIFKELCQERYERLTAIKPDIDWITKKIITDHETNTEREVTVYKDFSKRIDHRHHALDAIVIACTKQGFIQRINNLHQEYQKFIYDLVKKEEVKKILEKNNIEITYNFAKDILQINACEDLRQYLKDKKVKSLYKIRQPHKHFTTIVKDALENIIISHKKKNKILTKARNFYQKYEFDENGNPIKKRKFKQENTIYSVKGALHQETINGMREIRTYKSVSIKEAIIKLDKIADKKHKIKILKATADFNNDIKKIEKYFKENPLTIDGKVAIYEHTTVYTSKQELIFKNIQSKVYTRKYIGKILDKETANQMLLHLVYENIKEIPDKELLNNKLYLDYILERERPFYEIDNSTKFKLNSLIEFIDKNCEPKNAFNADGVNKFNENRKIPVLKVTVYETSKEERKCLNPDNKFNKKFVQIGNNPFFVIYEKFASETQTLKRDFESLNLYDVVTCMINGMDYIPRKEGYEKYFFLQTDDLVYVPEKDENNAEIDWNNKKEISKRIYKVVKSSGKTCYFIPHNIAKILANKIEFDTQNCIATLNGMSIKEFCFKLEIDRLGNIKPVKS